MTIKIETIQSLLRQKLGSQISNIETVESGQISETYFFEADGSPYVIRFARRGMSDSLYKDQYVSDQLVSQDVPVAEFICIDESEDLTYAVTRRAPGKTLDDFTGDDYEQLIPTIIETLDKIHQTDLEGTRRCGSFNAKGIGKCDSWPEFLTSVADEETGEDGFYGSWHQLFDRSFLDRDIFDFVFAEMDSLLRYCPQTRYLVHADYAYDNVLIDDGKITAVIDWANAAFGDFLYDVAWLDLGMEQWHYGDRFRQFYKQQNRDLADMEMRLRCYYCHIALDAFKFYAKTNQFEPYQWMAGRIQSLLNH